MEIETKNASLDTLAVTILALHVSGKQMTQAVFKQLPEDREIEGDSLWGVVRYVVPHEGYLWLVFSHGDKLFRRSLHPDAEPRTSVIRIEEDMERVKKQASRNFGDEPLPQKWKDHIYDLANEINEARAKREGEVMDIKRDRDLSKLKQLFIAV